MTYTYLTSVPLIIVYAVGFAVIKYQYGYTYVVGYGILPTPYEMWSEHARGAILPLYFCFSMAWSLEMVSHLEELCFWLFLVNSTSFSQDWFRTLYFKAWMVGSCVATIYMPLVTILTRGDLMKCEAYTFLAGSLGSLSLTIWFLPVLYAFPSFIESLRHSNVDKNILVRLTKYHELNCIRVVFRFLFTIPLLILGVDGVRPHQHINDKMLPTDLLAMIACIGVVISSGITLVIFFPRSIESEMAKRDAERERKRSMHTTSRPSQFTTGTRHSAMPSDVVLIEHTVSVPPHASTGRLHMREYHRGYGDDAGSMDGLPSYDRISVTDVDVIKDGERGNYHHPHHHRHQQQREPRERYRENTEGEGDSEGETAERERDNKFPSCPVMMLQPNRRTNDGDVELGGVVRMSRGVLTRHNMKGTTVSHLIHNWRSPIDMEMFSGS